MAQSLAPTHGGLHKGLKKHSKSMKGGQHQAKPVMSKKIKDPKGPKKGKMA
jgi:hypothetical protein